MQHNAHNNIKYIYMWWTKRKCVYLSRHIISNHHRWALWSFSRCYWLNRLLNQRDSPPLPAPPLHMLFATLNPNIYRNSMDKYMCGVCYLRQKRIETKEKRIKIRVLVLLLLLFCSLGFFDQIFGAVDEEKKTDFASLVSSHEFHFIIYSR